MIVSVHTDIHHLHTDDAPIPKQTPVYDVNKHLRPISLTPVLSKLAEDFVVDRYVKPAVLAKVDPRQFGTVPGSSTIEALISMTHAWYSATDGNKRGPIGGSSRYKTWAVAVYHHDQRARCSWHRSLEVC